MHNNVIALLHKWIGESQVGKNAERPQKEADGTSQMVCQS